MQRAHTKHPTSLYLADINLLLIDRAAKTTLEQSLVVMSHKGFAAFQTAIDTKPQIAPAIVALRQHKAPWDKP